MFTNYVLTYDPKSEEEKKKIYEDFERWIEELKIHVKAMMNYKVEKRFVRGDIIHVDFGLGIGSEMRSNHYAVVLTNSSDKNGIVQVVPLTSAKADGNFNPASSIFLGKIGDLNEKDSIALISQYRAVSKFRCLPLRFLKIITDEDYMKGLEAGTKLRCSNSASRLSPEQFKLIKKATYRFNKKTDASSND